MFDRYFADNHYESQPECLIRGIKRFPAGHNAWVKDGKITLKRYWNTLDHLISVPDSYEEQVEQFRFSLTPFLQSYAGIDREVMIVGRAGQAEIWDAEEFRKFEEENLTPEKLLASLEAIGL